MEFNLGGPRPPDARWMEFRAGNSAVDEEVGLLSSVRVGTAEEVTAAAAFGVSGGDEGFVPVTFLNGGGGGGMALRSKSAFFSFTRAHLTLVPWCLRPVQCCSCRSSGGLLDEATS